MRPRGWRSALGLLASGLITAASFTGCGKVEDSRGGLMLLVSTDGPLAIDRLDIAIVSADHDLLSNKYRVPEEVTLPTTVAIVSNGNPTAQATISVTGWAGTVPLDRRDAIVTQIPTDRVATLNVVLSARCSDKLTVNADGSAVSSCGDGNTCDNGGDCVTATVTALDLPTYHAGDENDAGIAGASSVDSSGGSGGESGAADGGAAGAGGSIETTFPTGGASGAGGSDDGGAAGGVSVPPAPMPCGNHLPNAGEECDDGGQSATCDADCTFPRCGDATINTKAGELCDEGDAKNGTYNHCGADCKSVGPHCGDSIVNGPELCDDGTNNGLIYKGCTPSCLAFGPRCGDGQTNGPEVCDDGTNIGGYNGCKSGCSARGPYCGDGVTTASYEVCDDGKNDNSYNGCGSDCTKRGPYCGDGTKNGPEVCDDGKNDGSYNGCGSDCSKRGPYCGDGTKNGPEVCDDGKNDGSYGGCAPDCKSKGPYCGDAIVDRDKEFCDDGALNGTLNHCRISCTGICGDSIVSGAEKCDDGPNNGKVGDPCPANCGLP